MPVDDYDTGPILLRTMQYMHQSGSPTRTLGCLGCRVPLRPNYVLRYSAELSCPLRVAAATGAQLHEIPQTLLAQGAAGNATGPQFRRLQGTCDRKAIEGAATSMQHRASIHPRPPAAIHASLIEPASQRCARQSEAYSVTCRHVQL